MSNPVNPGIVEWSGENPGIYLKDHEQGEWLALAVFFRVATSPHGRGTGVIVLGAPQRAECHPQAPNFCITDNEPLMRYLVADFVSRFASFRSAGALAEMPYLPLTEARIGGDAVTCHEESVCADDLCVTLRWDGLGTPFAVDVPPAMSATGEHQMYSVFVEARQASILVDGRPLPGSIVQRDFLGRRMSTGFLALSETWLRPVGA